MENIVLFIMLLCFLRIGLLFLSQVAQLDWFGLLLRLNYVSFLVVSYYFEVEEVDNNRVDIDFCDYFKVDRFVD
jgi:hypothetical protein